MKTAELLSAISNQGIFVSVVGEKINCRSTKPIPEDIIFKIRENKSNIIEFLSNGSPKLETKKTSWLMDNHTRLIDAGYTHEDLYHTNWPKGIVYLDLWHKPGLSVKLNKNVLVFTWDNGHGKTIQQTCRPESWL